MKLADLIVKLQGELAQHGNINVYSGDMEAPRIEVCETVDPGDVEIYGREYLHIDH